VIYLNMPKDMDEVFIKFRYNIINVKHQV
ncbi:MAG: hypothetical protein K0R06_2403, partial [Clostridium sp.]|nr:hypothetical protein [Clostridium sp.]